MGGCFYCNKSSKRLDTLAYADEVFNKIDKNLKGEINSDDIKFHFKEYEDTCVKILMEKMDFNLDKIITRSEWIGYWEYIRLSGQAISTIMISLRKINNGELYLNFPNARNYSSQQPRDTVIKKIVSDLKSEDNLPFKLQEKN